MKEINIDSIIGYTTYMQNRNPSRDLHFFATDEGYIGMQREFENNNIVQVIFLDDENVRFSYSIAKHAKTIVKMVNRPSLFNGAIIEFMTHDERHFIDLLNEINTHPEVMKHYSII